MNVLALPARGLASASLWANSADWRSWVSHAVIAALLTLVFGPAVAAGFYFLRELEQMWHRWAKGEGLNWFDHFMDVAAPAVAAVVVALLMGWLL